MLAAIGPERIKSSPFLFELFLSVRNTDVSPPMRVRILCISLTDRLVHYRCTRAPQHYLWPTRMAAAYVYISPDRSLGGAH